MGFLEGYPIASQPHFWSWSSKIQTFSRFLPYNLFDVSYVPDFFYQHKELCLDNLSDKLNIVIRRIEKFLRSIQKKFRVKTWGFLKLWGWEAMYYPSKNPIFSLETFFWMDLRNFSMRRMTMFNLSERLSKHSSLCW